MKYKINAIGWIGLLIVFTTMLFSCKKEDNKSASTGVPTILTSQLVGKYACNDSDPYTMDTIYIYESGSNYYITSPDAVTSMSTDTLGINIISMDFNIPSQTIYSTVSLNGNGSLVLSNQLNVSWTTSSPSNLSYTDVIYIKQ